MVTTGTTPDMGFEEQNMKYMWRSNPPSINDPQVTVPWDADRIPIPLLPLP